MLDIDTKLTLASISKETNISNGYLTTVSSSNGQHNFNELNTTSDRSL